MSEKQIELRDKIEQCKAGRKMATNHSSYIKFRIFVLVGYFVYIILLSSQFIWRV